MTSILGSLGTVGLAAALTAILWFGTGRVDGQAKGLGWGTTMVIAMLAGASYRAARSPFDLASTGVNDLIGLAGGMLPGLTMPGVALIMLAMVMWKKLSTRQVAVFGIAFFYVASGAGGAWSIVADRIALAAQHLAA
jgi:hypothetical protein